MSYLGLNTTTDDHAAKASPADVRRKNRQLIFRLLFPTNQYSRAELGRRTGLSRVAVSDVVGRMLEEGLLRETGQAPSGGKGKRGTLLGQPLRHAEVTLNTGSFVSVDVIIELIEKMLGMSDGEVIGIGVASPGVVDNGVVRSSTMRGWNNLDLSTPIAEHFGLEVNVSNDATAAMLTERFFGQGGPNMLFVRIERGIGSAILLSDTPVIGELHAAGELGHISIDLDGPLCPCGKHGCLETMISGTALKKQLSAADVEQHQGILARAGRYLGQALSMPVGLLDMADVCVYGQPNIINETFIDAAQQYLDAATSSSFHKHTVIRRCECGPDITVQGEAIAVVFQHLAK